MRHPKQFSIILLTSFLSVCIPTSVIAAEEPDSVSHNLKGERLNELAVWDLGADKIYEIFVSTVSGKAGCYRADSLEPLWEKKLSSSALTAPVIGDFMGTGAPILAFGTSTGEILFVWPATGLVISTLKTDSGFTLAPCVADFDNPPRQAVVFGDDQGQLVIAGLASDGNAELQHIIPNTVSDSTAFSVVGQFTNPPSSADVNGDGIPEVVIASDSGILQVVSLVDTPTRHFQRLAQQSQATTLAAIGPLSAGPPSIVLGSSANLLVYQWQPNPNGFIRQVMDTPAYGKSQGHILLAPVNADPIPDLLSSADNVIAARYLGTDLNGNEVFLDIAQRHLTTTAAPLSPAIAYTRADGNTAVLSIDNDGAVLEWQPAIAENSIREVSRIPVPTGFTPAGNLTGTNKLCLVAWHEKMGDLRVYALPIDVSPDCPAVYTLGSNFTRNGQWGGEWTHVVTVHKARAQEALAAAKAAYKPQDLESPDMTLPGYVISGIAPQDSMAIELAEKQQRFSRKFILLSFVLAATGIAAIGLLWHHLRKNR